MNFPPMTRRTFLVGAAALGVGGAAAVATAGPPFGGGTTISFWHLFSGGDGERMAEMLDSFARSGSAIDVEPVTQTWGPPYYTKLQLAAVGGRPPDADRVRVGCLAQLVNVLGPIRTQDGGPAWPQTIYFPFMHAARYARGTVLRVEPDSPTYTLPDEGDVPVLDATAVLTDRGLNVFALNRGASELALEVVLRELDDVRVGEHLVLCDDLGATNTAAEPDRVRPSRPTGAQ